MLEEDDYILDFDEQNLPLEYATREQRLANYIIDQVAILVLAILATNPILLSFDLSEADLENKFVTHIITISLTTFYYCLVEYFSGQSIGKMVTRTKVVTVSGEAPSFVKILLRTLCRFIPFEQFSFLVGNASEVKGWHDKISKTKVIKVV